MVALRRRFQSRIDFVMRSYRKDKGCDGSPLVTIRVWVSADCKSLSCCVDKTSQVFTINLKEMVFVMGIQVVTASWARRLAC